MEIFTKIAESILFSCLKAEIQKIPMPVLKIKKTITLQIIINASDLKFFP
jgi:hypothetical protein